MTNLSNQAQVRKRFRFFKTICKTFSLIIVFTLFSNLTINAQEKKEELTKDNYQPFNAGLHLKNMHIWHGFLVQPGPIFATNLEYNSRNKKITLGLWGGSSFASTDVGQDQNGNNVTGNYKEVSMYAVYRFNTRFFTEVVSHNNYTGVAERGEDLNYFSYDRDQTYNFIDVNFGYQITPSFSLYAGTILFGQASDTELQPDGSLDNNWTTYVEAKAKLYDKDGYQLTGVVAGAFSLVTEKTFYTEEQANIINVSLVLAKKINWGNFTVPVEVTGMWNPEKKITVLQVDLTLF